MADFDIFNPQQSKVIKSIEGKIITIYGNSGTGKSKQCSKFSKPLYLCFEEGLGAIGGVSKLPVETWSDFVKYNKQLCSKTTVEKAREMYDTIILDSIDAMESLCTEYVCLQNGVRAIGDIPHGAGYKIYENTFWKEINKLTKVGGYTCIFIGHPKTIQKGEKQYITIKGDIARTVEPITSRSDIVAYLQPMGIDENGKPVHSSAFLVETEDFFARSRFEQIVPYLNEFTAENLEKAIVEAINKEEESVGSNNMTTYEENKKATKIDRKTYEELMEEMTQVGQKIAEAEKMEDLTYIVEQHLGVGKKATNLKKGQEQVIEAILMDLKDFMEEEKIG